MRSKRDKQRRRRDARKAKQLRKLATALLNVQQLEYALDQANARPPLREFPVAWYDEVNRLQVDLLKQYGEYILTGMYERSRTAYRPRPQTHAAEIVTLDGFRAGFNQCINRLRLQGSHDAAGYLTNLAHGLGKDLGEAIADRILKSIPELVWK